MFVQSQEEHRWLQKFVGTWTFEGECSMGPDQPPMKSTGTEYVRTLGGLWTIGEGKAEMPGGGECISIMTLGYDPVRKRFVGTFIASMMTHLWIYDGGIDATGRILTLGAQGPDMSGGCGSGSGGAMANYRDIFEFLSDTHRTLTSRMQAKDGTWNEIMKAHYRKTG